MSIKSDVRRPALYAISGLVAMALALPLAIASGQSQANGMFEECFETSCSGETKVAKLD
ncbi:MAG: hypothetical protein V3V30_08190 [Parvularculaceae bacterium]